MPSASDPACDDIDWIATHSAAGMERFLDIYSQETEGTVPVGGYLVAEQPVPDLSGINLRKRLIGKSQADLSMDRYLDEILSELPEVAGPVRPFHWGVWKRSAEVHHR